MELCKDVVEWALPLGHEKDLIEFVKNNTPEHMDTFIDIGANVGTWTLHLGDKFRQIFAFEPFHEARKVLHENLILNHMANVEVFSCAISDYCGDAILQYYKTGGHSTLLSEHPIRNEVGEYVGNISVSTATINTIFNPYQMKIDMIKIDTEGSEPEIIRGGLEIIRKHNPRLIIEIHDIKHIDIIKNLLPEITFTEYKWCNQTYLLKLDN